MAYYFLHYNTAIKETVIKRIIFYSFILATDGFLLWLNLNLLTQTKTLVSLMVDQAKPYKWWKIKTMQYSYKYSTYIA